MGLFRRDKDADLRAAAAIVDPTDHEALRKIKSNAPKNAKDNWTWYDALPEVHYPATFMGSALQRFDFKIARRVVRDGKIEFADDDNALAWKILLDLDNGDGISELARLFGVMWTVDADCWLYGTEISGQTHWSLWSNNEVEILDAFTATGRVGMKIDGKLVKSTDYVRRVWRRHPGRRVQADSSLTALHEPCKQLKTLYDVISASLDSRLASAGILFVPNTIQMAGEVSRPNGTGRKTARPIIQQIADVMELSMASHDTAAARIPIMVSGPSGEGDKIVHITLDRLVSEAEMAQRRELRDAIAQGLDMPSEMQQGMGDANHWSTWSIQDSSYRASLKPVGDAWAMALTSVVLKPSLVAAGASATDVSELYIVADGSDLVARPTEGQDAFEMHDRGTLSGTALRARTGIDESERMEDEEYVRWLGVQQGDPYLATLGLPIASKIDWAKVKTAAKAGPPGAATPVRAKVGPGNSTAGRPGGGAGGNAGGVKGAGRAAELAPAAVVGYRAAFTHVGARLRAMLAQPSHADLAAQVKGVPNQLVHTHLPEMDFATARQATRGVLDELLADVCTPEEIAAFTRRMVADVVGHRAPSLTIDEAHAIIESTDEES